MKIIKLIAENVKGIKAIEITPDGHFQQISGKNGQGKSSVLDAIWLALGGKDASKGTEKPLRDGQSEGFSFVDLGDIKVTRKWKGDKTTLDVSSKDGAKYNSPQGMLDDLIGKLSFDPLSFATQDDKKQKATLQELVGINFDTLDKERAGHYEERTFHNVSAKKLEGALSELPLPNPDTPREELSASDIINELGAANEITIANDKKRREFSNLTSHVNGLKAEIADIETKLKQKNLELDDARTLGIKLKSEVESLIDPDTTTIQSKLQNIETINKQVASAAKFRRLEGEIAEYKESSNWLTKKIEDIDRTKLDTLQSAEFPIIGLSFDENGVTFNSIPFKQCSAAERLKISMAMAMAMNPKLRVIRIMDGSLLDSDNMKVIKEMALEKDYQVWIEVVDESGTMGVMIEDGQIKEVATI